MELNDLYKLVLPPGEEITAATTDDEILSLMPKSLFSGSFNYRSVFGEYGKLIKELTPDDKVTTYTIETPEEGAKAYRYVYFLDQYGLERMRVNVETGVLQHAEMSRYQDPDTGYVVEVPIVTDGAFVEAFGEYNRIIVEPRENIARAFFTEVFAVQNMAENHKGEFKARVGLKGEAHDTFDDRYIYEKFAEIDMEERDEMLEEFRQVLKQDIQALGPGESIRIQLGASGLGEVRLDSGGKTVIEVDYLYSPTRLCIGKCYGESYDGFYTILNMHYGAEVSFTNTTRAYFILDDRMHYGYHTFGIGPLPSLIRSFIAAGFPYGAARAYSSFMGKKAKIGFGDNVAKLICGEKEFAAYLRRLAEAGYPGYEEYEQVPIHMGEYDLREQCGVGLEMISE